MGMVAGFASLDPAEADRLRNEPELMEAWVYPDDGESEPPNSTDIDKSWHCIHFMLNGDADGGDGPLAEAILGGEPVGEDVGYGPARILAAQQVQEVAQALQAVDDDTFQARFDPKAMKAAGVYLADMCVRDGQEALDYLLHHFRELRSFYSGAASRGEAAVLWLA